MKRLEMNVIEAPSKSRPRMRQAKVQADAQAVKDKMGATGVASFTEISNMGARKAVKAVFGKRRYHPLRSDCPIVWTSDFELVHKGNRFGCARIGPVAPTRHTTWVLLRHKGTGIYYFHDGTHMMPGGWRPSARQRPYVPLIQKRWRRHKARIENLVARWRHRAHALGTGADANHPGSLAFRRDTRLTGPGLLYLGIQRGTRGKGGSVKVLKKHSWRQNADHRAFCASIEITVP